MNFINEESFGESFLGKPQEQTEEKKEKKKEKKVERRLSLPKEALEYWEEKHGYYIKKEEKMSEIENWLLELYPKLSKNKELLNNFVDNINDNFEEYAWGMDADWGKLKSETLVSKYNSELRRLLSNKLYREAKAITFAFSGDWSHQKDLIEPTMVDEKFQYKKAFERFFEPLLKKEENQKKLQQEIEENNEEKKIMSGKLTDINEKKSISKDERKKRQREFEEGLLGLSRLRKPLEKKFKESEKAADILLNFIPGYQKDFEEQKETAGKIDLTKEKQKQFNQEWKAKNMEKAMRRLRKFIGIKE